MLQGASEVSKDLGVFRGVTVDARDVLVGFSFRGFQRNYKLVRLEVPEAVGGFQLHGSSKGLQGNS